MFIRILTDDHIKYLKKQIKNKNFSDGKQTQSITKFYDIKQNKERGIPEGSRKYLIDILYNNAYIDSVYCPNRISVNFFSRYTEGDFYDFHVDSFKATPKSNNIFYDYGFSISLNSEYEGGEFIVKTEAGEIGYKLEAGQGVVFPIMYPHKVNTITKGIRENIIGWFSSKISYEQMYLLNQLQESSMMLTELVKEDKSKTTKNLLITNILVQNYLKKHWGK